MPLTQPVRVVVARADVEAVVTIEAAGGEVVVDPRPYAVRMREKKKII